MKIAVIGSGYVGLVTGTCFAEIGNEVTCVDNNPKKIENLEKGILPIYEPGLEDLVIRNVRQNRLKFTTDIAKTIQENDVIFSAVGTPSDKDFRADLSAVKAVAASVGKHANGYKILVTKSTVPVGTADVVKKVVLKNQKTPYPFSIVSNPEFLREGSAVKDFLHPDRVVVGVDDLQAGKAMKELYKPLTDDQHPLIIMDVKSAEITKYAANSFLATKITFINEMANFCEIVGADVTQVARGIGSDNRIGAAFLKAGIGYGGSCFPKDVKAIIHSGDLLNFDFRILDAVEVVNRKQKQKILIKLRELLPNIEKLKIAVWGLSFKANTDDVRDAPSLPIIRRLAELGAKIYAFDPIASDNFKAHFPNEQNLHYVADPYTALKGASALIVLTDWQEFLEPDFEKMVQLMKKPNIIDGRNIYDLQKLQSLGFIYRSIGRPDVNIPKKK